MRMQRKPSKKSRSRAEILAEIAALPPSVQGTISSYRRPRKNGPPAVYHKLQYTRGGKNHSFSIPVGKVSEFKAAAIFRASTTSDNAPHRDIGTTSCVATTHRTEKFGKLVRAEFDRRFGQVPETTLDVTDGSKWLQTVWRNGWFIGSGVIESGCKTVIGQRFKQSGMFWSLKGAKALPPLHTLHKSNRLEEFFAYLVRDLRQIDCAA